MQAGETRLQPMIEGTKQYVVPLFQRPYSWDKKEWGILWDDLVDLCQMDNPRTHFLGSMVTMPTISVPEGVTKYLLIDGQQRLTTVFILLALLRDNAIKDSEAELSEEIEKTLLVNPYKKDSDYFKLQPSQVDRSSFRKVIQSGILSDQDQITSAYSFFDRKLRQSGLDGRTLKKVLTTNLSIVSIVLGSEDNPYLVFESLNAKGRPLTQSDLIRNYFFMRIHIDDQETIYLDHWKPMQDALGENLTECIRHYLMRNGEIVRQNDVYFSLKDRINKGDALKYLKDLARFAGYYQKLLYPEEEPNLKIRRALSRLNRIEVTVAYPFLLNCYDDYCQNRISSDEFADILAVIENFMIRRFVCNVPSNRLNKIFPPLYAQIQAGRASSFVGGVRSALQTKDYPKDAQFKSRLLDAKLYGSGDRAIKTKLILETLEESYGHKERVSFEDLSIEHVMPQTLTEHWQNHLGDEWEMTHELLLHTLGNLTLTAYNPELSNDDFADKRNRFVESHLEINKYFKGKSSWKREEIEERSKQLTEIALAIWPYFGDEAIGQGEAFSATRTIPKRLWILGQRFTVETWRDVLEQTMNTIAELEPEKFDMLLQQFPRLIGRDKRKFRAVRELKNGVFMEVNLSSQNIQRFCGQALESVDLTLDDWRVDTDQLTS